MLYTITYTDNAVDFNTDVTSADADKIQLLAIFSDFESAAKKAKSLKEDYPRKQFSIHTLIHRIDA